MKGNVILTTNRFSCEFTDYCINDFLNYQVLIIKVTASSMTSEPISIVRKTINDAIQDNFEAPVLAICYNKETLMETEYSPSAFLMFRKQPRLFRTVRTEIETKYGNLKVSKVDIEEEMNNSFFKSSLCQLLCSYIVNQEHGDKSNKVINNILGKIFCSLPFSSKGWNRKWKSVKVKKDREGKTLWSGEDFIHEHAEIKVSLGLSFTPEFILKAVAIPFVKLSPKNGRKLKKMGYEWGKLGFRKAENQYQGKLYYQQGEEDIPSHIPYFKPFSWKDFITSKVFHIWDFVQTINNFNIDGEKLLHLSSWDYNNIDVHKLSNELNKDEFFINSLSYLKNNFKIALLDNKEELTDDELHLAEKIKNWLDSKGLKTNDNSVNILAIHHCHDFYNERNIVDSRIEFTNNNPNFVTQSVTFDSLENLKEKPFGLIMENVVNTLFIKSIIKSSIKKDELINGITFRNFGVQNILTFVTREYDGVKKDDRFYILKLNPNDNTCHFSNFYFKSRCLYENGEEIANAFMKQQNTSIAEVNGNIEFIVFANIKDIYVVEKTEERWLPSEDIFTCLKNSTKQISKKVLTGFLEDYKSSKKSLLGQDDMDYINRVETNIKDYSEAPLTINNVQKLIRITETTGDKKKLIYGHQYNMFRDFCIEEKGIRFGTSYIRSLPECRKYSEGGWWFQTPDYKTANTISVNSITYCIGLGNTIQMAGMDKGLVMRNIVRQNGEPIDKTLVTNLLKMCTVDFVKLGGWSVRPFPLKFIREYVEMIKLNKLEKR